MIRAEDLIPDDIVRDVGVQEPLGDDKVVQPPSDVLGPTVHHVGPEGVGFLLVGIEMAERVHHVALFQGQFHACNKKERK